MQERDHNQVIKHPPAVNPKYFLLIKREMSFKEEPQKRAIHFSFMGLNVETEINQLNAFHKRCLRRICKIYWPNKISNDELYAKTECYSMATEVKHRRHRWLGHVLIMEQKGFLRVSRAKGNRQGQKWH